MPAAGEPDAKADALPDFRQRIAGFQAIVSESAQTAKPGQRALGGGLKAASFVQKMKGAWQARQAAEQASPRALPARASSPPAAAPHAASRDAAADEGRDVGRGADDAIGRAASVDEDGMDERLTAVCARVAGWWKWRTTAHLFDRWVAAAHEKGEADAPPPPVAAAPRKRVATRAAAPQTRNAGPIAVPLPDDVPLLTTCGGGAVFVAAEAGGAAATLPVAAARQQGPATRSARPAPAGTASDPALAAGDDVPAAVRRMLASLEVVGCPSAAVLGRNRVYLPTAVYAAFSQFQASQSGASPPPSLAAEPVLIAVNGIAFEAWAAPDLVPTAIALDSVQAVSASTSIGERARVWPLDLSSGLCNVVTGLLSVRLKDKSSNLGLSGLDKNRFSEHCFQVLQGQPLSAGQRLLIGYGYWRLEVSVDRIDDPWSANLAAFHQGKHGRLGARSWVSLLPPKALIRTSQLFWQDACVNTLVSNSSKLIYNFWDGANYEGKRSAEGVLGGGREHVLIRGDDLVPRADLALRTAISPTLGKRASSPNKGPSSLPLTFSPAPLSDVVNPQPLPTIGPSTDFLTFGLPSQLWTTQSTGSSSGTIEKPGYSSSPIQKSNGVAHHSPAMEQAGFHGPRAGISGVSTSSPHQTAITPPAADMAASSMHLFNSQPGLPVGSKTSKADAISNMLLNAGLEHQETLLQLDEMSTLAATSLQREQKFVEIIKAVVSRNLTKGGDWIYLGTVLQDYSEEVRASLQIIEKQNQRKTQNGHSHNRRKDKVPVSSRAPTLEAVEEGKEDSSASRLHDLEYGREEARTRANEAQRIHQMALSVPRDQRRSISPLASSLSGRNTSPGLPGEQGKESSSQRDTTGSKVVAESSTSFFPYSNEKRQDGSTAGPGLSDEQGKMSSSQRDMTKSTVVAGNNTPSVPSSNKGQQDGSTAGSEKPGTSQSRMAREAARSREAAERAKELKEAIHSPIHSPHSDPAAVTSTDESSSKKSWFGGMFGGSSQEAAAPSPPPASAPDEFAINNAAASTHPSSSPAPANTHEHQQPSADAKDAPEQNPRVILTVVSAEHLPSMDFMGKCDGLVEINWDGQNFKTTAKKQSYDPVWNEDFTFKFDCAEVNAKGVGDLILSLKDWDATSVTSYDHIGQAMLPASRLNTFLTTGKDRASFTEAGLAVHDKKGAQVIGKDKQACTLTVKLQLFLDPVLPTDSKPKNKGGWFGGMFGGGSSEPGTESQDDGGANSTAPSITKAKVAVSRSAAPPRQTVASGFSGSQKSLTGDEKLVLDQNDDELDKALDSGTLPPEVRVLYFCIWTMRCYVVAVLYLTEDEGHWQDAIAQARQTRGTPSVKSGAADKLDPPLPPPSASSHTRLDPTSPPSDGGSLFGRPSPAQLLSGTVQRTTAVGKQGSEKERRDEGPTPSPPLKDKRGADDSLDSPLPPPPASSDTRLDPTSPPSDGGSLFGRPSPAQLLSGAVQRTTAAGTQGSEEERKDEAPTPGGSLFSRPSPAQLLSGTVPRTTAVGTQGSEKERRDEGPTPSPLLKDKRKFSNTSSGLTINQASKDEERMAEGASGGLFGRPSPAQLLSGGK